MLIPEAAHAETDRTQVPLLIYKAGALGDTPLAFPKMLAREYSAAYVSSDEIRRDLMNGTLPGLRPGRDIIRTIRRIARDRASQALEKGDDVVLDMFVNSPRTRDELANVAEGAGALTVAILAHTPRSVVLERVAMWAEHDAFVIPTAEWDIPPEQAARTMMNGFQPPSEDERIDCIVTLRGTAAIPQLIGQFDAQLQAQGLDDTK